jgi:uncharacterized membrane protein
MSFETVKPNAELRYMARQQLKGRWGMPILAGFLFWLISGIPGAIPYIGWIIALVVGGPLTLGMVRYFIKWKREENPTIETLFDGFKEFTPSLVLYLLTILFTVLWMLLFFVPGIIAAYRYSQAFYIMNDNPGLPAMEAINRSKEMMMGYKGKLFLLHLSFFGWGILCLFTLGIGFLWLGPYYQLTMAHFYENLKNSKEGAFAAESGTQTW